ncbi:molybdopterin oxidoreductase family protein [Streptomyces sp. OF3]|uniref:Molybdopterin oxidoreductase family protein n=1 Tax=Streptomyces alkaliterrae TaxID=2213162 RepID=A0A7W3WJ81_9ACTN|nr:molybdopterin-dependent oxidoreductase [Streptomyces alkaliterrae]MBB1253312.1 molybdopterin oxidoreductase family protein [Streptomyces alkaliterrae]
MYEQTAEATVTTHCPYCALQCGTRLTDDGAGSTRVAPTDFPVNRGRLCQKGWTAPAVLTTADRLTRPLLRGADGRLAESDWPTALDTVADRLRELRERHGPDSVAVFGGGGLTNEKAYLLGKFARVALGTSQIDYNGRFCMSSAAAAGNAAFGVDRGLPFPVTDLADADAVLLAGANVAETMPPLTQHLERAALVAVDPRRTATARRSALHLQPAPGTDLALALGLLHVAVAEGLVDQEYVRRRTNGFPAAARRAAAWRPERVEAVTGVPAGAQREAVHLLAAADRAYVLTGRGVEQHSKGTDTAAAYLNLALALGLPGTPGSGYGTLTGQGNGQGGREMGQKSDQLPGYRSLTDPAARAHVARVWGVPPESLPGPGRTAYELLDSLGRPGGPRALLVFGSNPAVSAPHAARVVDRLTALDLLVVADFVPSETARLADVVLPVAQWAEEEGTLTGLEGRVLRRRALRPPPPGVRDDLDVLHGLAIRLGQPAERFPADAREVFEELRDATRGARADYSGISYPRLDAGEALYWPCPADPPTAHDGPAPAATSAGTPRLFLERFHHPDGRARFAEVDHRGPAEPTSERYPLLATTGRVLAHYQSGAQTRRVAELAGAVPEPVVEVHPDTAARAGLVDRGLVRVSSARGGMTARVRLDATMRPDTVFAPFHFAGDARANLFTHPALDPRSGMPEFKVSAVRLDAVPDPAPDPGGAPDDSGVPANGGGADTGGGAEVGS